MGEALTTAISTVTTVFGNVWTMVTGNDLCMIFIGVSVLTAAVGLFATIKGSVR